VGSKPTTNEPVHGISWGNPWDITNHLVWRGSWLTKLPCVTQKQGFAQKKKPTRMASLKFTTNKLKPTNMRRCWPTNKLWITLDTSRIEETYL